MSQKSKKSPLLFILPLVIFIGLVVMLFSRLGKPTHVEFNNATSRSLPTFSLPLLSDTDKTVTNADMPKTPYLLNIWGSWCPTCLVEHPMLMELSKQGVPMIGVNYKDEVADGLTYLNNHGNPFLLSVRDEEGMLALDLGLTGAPETFVVGSDGMIRQHIVGEIHQENWKDRIEPCMALLRQTDVTNEKMAEVCQ